MQLSLDKEHSDDESIKVPSCAVYSMSKSAGRSCLNHYRSLSMLNGVRSGLSSEETVTSEVNNQLIAELGRVNIATHVRRTKGRASERRFSMWRIYYSRRHHASMLFDQRSSKRRNTPIYDAIRTSRLRFVSALLLIVAVGVLIVGCDSSPYSNPESNSPTTPPSQSTPTSNPTSPPESTPTSVVSTGCSAQPDIICGRLVDSQ
jgi:hypothetical protein